MRSIDYIVLHCTATSKSAKVSSIQKYWKERLGWKNPGYHFIVEQDGNIKQLQDLDKPTNGVRGYNSNSIHISYIGGKQVDDRTPEQEIALEAIVKVLHAMFPKAKIQGHRDFPGVKKSCPRFDAIPWSQNILNERSN